MKLNHNTDGLLLELALAIGANTGSGLLNVTLPVLVEKLDCGGVMVLRFNALEITGSVAYSLSKGECNMLMSKASGIYTKLIGKSSYMMINEDSAIYYAFMLNGYGLLVLNFSESLQSDYIRELLPLMDHLAKACVVSEKLEGSLFAGEIDLTSKPESKDETLNNNESSLNSIFDNVPFQMWLKDVDGKYVAVNKAYMDYFSITDKSEIIGKDALEIWNNEVGLHFAEQDKKVMQSRELLSVEELIDFKHKSVWFEIFRAPIFSKNGNLLGTTGIARDITSRKADEKVLQKALETAEAATEAKSKYLAIMSHEIRNPLNAVVGMVRMLSESKIQGPDSKLVENIKTSADHLLMIVNDILDFSKIESGDMILENTCFDIHEVVEKVYKSHLFMASEKHIGLNFNIDTQIGHLHLGDPLRLQQVLANLVSNAIKFTSEGRIKITLGLESDSDKKNRIRFEVEDTGIGISAESHQKIFESFKQEENSTSRNFGGSGLGLAISKQIVELMGGELLVNSVKNQGSTFYFTIDLQVADVDKNVGVVAGLMESENQLTGKSVLLVEDNKLNQILATTILEKWGAQVVIAGNGQHALDFLATDSFDFILMDIQMPVMDGLTASKIIREKLNIKTPILALSANVVKGVAEKCEEAGMQGYISKPFDSDDLYRKMIMHMAKYETKASKIADVEQEFIVADVSRLEKMIGSDPAQLKIMISKFLEITPSYINELNKGDQENDLEVIAAISHKIKSSIDLVASPMLREVILTINRLSKDDCDMADLKPIIRKFNTYYRLLEIQLSQRINSERVYHKVS